MFRLSAPSEATRQCTGGAPGALAKWRMPLLLLATTLAGASGIRADETSGDEPQKEVVAEEITVVDRAADSDVADVVRIPREEIEQAGARTAADVLRFTTGLHLLSAGSRGGAAHAQIRGGDPNFTVVLLDGVPINDPTDLQGGATNLSTLSTDHIDEVQVLRGPHSYYFGSNAVAGVVNLTTRRGNDGPRGRVGLEAGSHSLFRGGLSYGSGDASRDFFVAGETETEDGTIADDSFEQSSLATSLGRQLGDRVRLRFVGRFADNKIDDYPESSGGPVYGSGDVRHAESESLTGGFNADLSTSRWHHTASLTYTSLQTESDSPAVFPLVPPSVEDRRYTRSQLNFLSLGDVSSAFEFALGAQIDREDGDNRSLLLLPDFFGGPVRGDYEIERTTPGAFVEGTFRSGSLTLDLGLRGDDPEDIDVEWSPRLAAVYAFGDSGWRLRSAWTQGFKLPSFFSLASPPQLGGNPNLRPETSEGADLGIQYTTTRSGFSLTVFSNRYDDLIDFDFETFQQINRARVDAEGAELSGRYRPTRRIALALDWTFQEVIDVVTGDPLLNEPDWFGSVRAEWQATPDLNLHVDARFSAGSLDVQLPVPNRDSVEGYEVLGFALVWRLNDRLRLTGRVDNLTDEEWEQFIGFPQPGLSGRAGIVWSLL